jgi:hypothetical protein
MGCIIIQVDNKLTDYVEDVDSRTLHDCRNYKRP